MKKSIHNNPGVFFPAHVLVALIIMVLPFSPVNAQMTVTNGTTVKILAATSLNSSENLVINSGGTVDVQGTLILKKNLQNLNAAANSLGSGVVQMSGTTNQSVTGQNIIRDMTINNAAGVTIGGNTQVNGVFTLTSGLVTLGGNNLTLGSTATIGGAPSAASMVVATSAGELRKEFASASTFVYPVGDNTAGAEYSPVTLAFTAGTFGGGNYAGVKLTDAQFPGTAGSYLTRYWQVSSSGITNFACNPTFQYLAADAVGTEPNIFCTKVDVLPWVTYNAANTGTKTINATGLAAFGTFTGNLGNGVTPPAVRSLQDKIIGAGMVTCADATQTLIIAGNGTNYWVQNGGSVTHIAGTNIIYLPGTRVDLGGYMHGYISTTYCSPYNHPIVPQTIAGLGDEGSNNGANSSLFKIYPNPTPGNFTLELKGDNPAENVKVEIFGILGERLMSKEMKLEKKQEFSLSERPTGVYVIHVSSGNTTETQKIIKR